MPIGDENWKGMVRSHRVSQDREFTVMRSVEELRELQSHLLRSTKEGPVTWLEKVMNFVGVKSSRQNKAKEINSRRTKQGRFKFPSRRERNS